MTGTRCGFCGMETEAAYCPRCRARIAPQPTQASYGDARRVGVESGGRALRKLVALALLAAVACAVYSFRNRIWYGPGAEYAVAIRDSAQFRAPFTLPVSKRLTALSNSAVPLTIAIPSTPAWGGAYVLEARGLVSFGAVSNEERVTGTATNAPALKFLGSQEQPKQYTLVENYDNADVLLTPEGRREAIGWTDTGDGAWHVPVGTREMYNVKKVGESKFVGGVETREIEFTWRWAPNALGEAFDTDGKVLATLPYKAHEAARALGWSSTKLYRAVARIERNAGGAWRVAEIRKSESIDRRTEVSAF